MQLRLTDITEILNSDLPKHKKITLSCHRLSGLDITNMVPAIEQIFAKHLYEMNSIVACYPIYTWDDYALIAEVHLNKMLKSIKRLCKRLRLNKSE